MPSAFLDTNIIIYAATRNDPEKAAKAQELIAPGDFGISVQILQEFYANFRKPHINLSDEQLNVWIGHLLEFECAVMDTDIFITAIGLSRRYQISYWDGAIIAAAQRLGAKTLYTEDLNHGQDYGSVTAINPFLEAEEA